MFSQVNGISKATQNMLKFADYIFVCGQLGQFLIDKMQNPKYQALDTTTNNVMEPINYEWKWYAHPSYQYPEKE